MKIEFNVNDYIDIYRIRRDCDGITLSDVRFGKIFEQYGREFTSLTNETKYFQDIDFFDFMCLLGFNLDDFKNIIDCYLYQKDAFIRIKKLHNKTQIYSFLENDTEEEIASSTDLFDLIRTEILHKENNASL